MKNKIWFVFILIFRITSVSCTQKKNINGDLYILFKISINDETLDTTYKRLTQKS